MDIKTGLATVGLLVMGSHPTFAELRNWLAPLPDTRLPGTSNLLNLSDSIDYGSRAQVRVYRPDGIYELRNGKYERSTSGFGDAGTETADD